MPPDASDKHPLTVAKGVELAIRHPEKAGALLAKTLASIMHSEQWIDHGIKARFCVLFVHNLLDSSIEACIDRKLYRRMLKLPFLTGIRLLKRHPDEGLKVLVAVVMKELRDTQKLPFEEQVVFYNELFAKLFPDSTLIEVNPAADNS